MRTPAIIGRPRILGSLIARLLALSSFSRLVGLEAPLMYEVLTGPDSAATVGIPVLIIHSKNDWSVPF